MAEKNELKLAALIARYLKAKREIEEVKEALQAEMKAAKLKEFRAPSGAKAALYEKDVYKFDVGKLEKALSPAQFKELCPPAPDTPSLRLLIETDPKMKRLARCAEVRQEKYVVVYSNGN